ncbi:hypothetical protein NMY22_g19700 [Coprinellus aureogranulatus]|nr:hypothetical protein NMY22_g19700 [Coprinellus aureogranulatus]
MLSASSRRKDSVQARLKAKRYTAKYKHGIAKGNASYQRSTLSLAECGMLVKRLKGSRLKRAAKTCSSRNEYIVEFMRRNGEGEFTKEKVAYDLLALQKHPDMDAIYASYGCLPTEEHLNLVHQVLCQQSPAPRPPQAFIPCQASVSISASLEGHTLFMTSSPSQPPSHSAPLGSFGIVGQRSCQVTADKRASPWRKLSLSRVDPTNNIYEVELLPECLASGRRFVLKHVFALQLSHLQRLLRVELDAGCPTSFEVSYSFEFSPGAVVNPSDGFNVFRVIPPVDQSNHNHGQELIFRVSNC